MRRVSTHNARFQQWEALLANRTKRQRGGEFLVQGVRPITMALRSGWPVRELLYHADAQLSGWARETLTAVDTASRVAVAGELMHALGGKAETIGTLVRSADAFGAGGVIVTGHAADVYDPASVRASTGSLFALPVVRVPSHRPVLGWVDALRAGGLPVRVVGADEHGERPAASHDFTAPSVLLAGNETTGLSAAWRDACDELVRIPMVGTASSLNAATAASILLYEVARQRGGAPAN